jgi:hypothetical protein
MKSFLIFSQRKKVSPHKRSSTQQGIGIHSRDVIHIHAGVLLTYENTIHPLWPIVWGTENSLRPWGAGFLKTVRKAGVQP